MKYLRKFETEADVVVFNSPNVVLIGNTGEVKYNVPPLYGVYIQHIDGAFYDEAGWTNGGFSNDEANGVAVITAKASFVIAKTDLGQMAWSSNTSSTVDGILTTADKTTALTDFAGYDNTQLMLATDTSGAGYSCANFTFPNGGKGYLPALGELNEAYKNESKINSLMTKIGGAEFRSSSNCYWSSTQDSSNKSWGLRWDYGHMNSSNKVTSYFYVRAFSTL